MVNFDARFAAWRVQIHCSTRMLSPKPAVEFAFHFATIHIVDFGNLRRLGVFSTHSQCRSNQAYCQQIWQHRRITAHRRANAAAVVSEHSASRPLPSIQLPSVTKGDDVRAAAREQENASIYARWIVATLDPKRIVWQERVANEEFRILRLSRRFYCDFRRQSFAFSSRLRGLALPPSTFPQTSPSSVRNALLKIVFVQRVPATVLLDLLLMPNYQ